MNIFRGMKQRCYNEKAESYKHYGGRGIKICDEWLENPELFYEWAIENGYNDGLTIDRIDNDGNYEPSNCRWATMKEQANNTRRNVVITYNGISHKITDWSKITGIDEKTLRQRYNSGYTEKEIFLGKYKENMLKGLREALGYTQGEFAKKLGTSRENIANYETFRREPSAAFLMRLQKKFNLSNAFIGGIVIEFALQKETTGTDR
jgi:DNA-binding XRE family transcriptional regulator